MYVRVQNVCMCLTEYESKIECTKKPLIIITVLRTRIPICVFFFSDSNEETFVIEHVF